MGDADMFFDPDEENTPEKWNYDNLSKWQNHLKQMANKPSYSKQLMNNVAEFIEYAINYLSTIKNHRKQIFISRRSFETVKDIVMNKRNNAFVKEVTKRIFDIVIEDDAETWCIKKELLKVFNECVELASKTVRHTTINQLQDICLYKMVDSISTYGDYDLQVTLIETVFRMFGRTRIISRLKYLIPESQELSETFVSINSDTFDEDARAFLNKLNKATGRTFSIICNAVHIGDIVCIPPMEHINGLWVDFNLADKVITWYCYKRSFFEGDENIGDHSVWVLITAFVSDIETVKHRRLPEGSGILIFFKLKNSLISSCEENQPVLDARDHFALHIMNSENLDRLITHILPQLCGDKLQSTVEPIKKASVSQKPDSSTLNKSIFNSEWSMTRSDSSFLILDPGCGKSIITTKSKNSSENGDEDSGSNFQNDTKYIEDTHFTETAIEPMKNVNNTRDDQNMSMHSSLSSELLSVEGDMERIQILSQRRSGSNYFESPKEMSTPFFYNKKVSKHDFESTLRTLQNNFEKSDLVKVGNFKDDVASSADNYETAEATFTPILNNDKNTQDNYSVDRFQTAEDFTPLFESNIQVSSNKIESEEISNPKTSATKLLKNTRKSTNTSTNFKIQILQDIKIPFPNRKCSKHIINHGGMKSWDSKLDEITGDFDSMIVNTCNRSDEVQKVGDHERKNRTVFTSIIKMKKEINNLVQSDQTYDVPNINQLVEEQNRDGDEQKNHKVSAAIKKTGICPSVILTEKKKKIQMKLISDNLSNIESSIDAEICPLMSDVSLSETQIDEKTLEATDQVIINNKSFEIPRVTCTEKENKSINKSINTLKEKYAEQKCSKTNMIGKSSKSIEANGNSFIIEAEIEQNTPVKEFSQILKNEVTEHHDTYGIKKNENMPSLKRQQPLLKTIVTKYQDTYGVEKNENMPSLTRQPLLKTIPTKHQDTYGIDMNENMPSLVRQPLLKPIVTEHHHTYRIDMKENIPSFKRESLVKTIVTEHQDTYGIEMNETMPSLKREPKVGNQPLQETIKKNLEISELLSCEKENPEPWINPRKVSTSLIDPPSNTVQVSNKSFPNILGANQNAFDMKKLTTVTNKKDFEELGASDESEKENFCSEIKESVIKVDKTENEQSIIFPNDVNREVEKRKPPVVEDKMKFNKNVGEFLIDNAHDGKCLTNNISKEKTCISKTKSSIANNDSIKTNKLTTKNLVIGNENLVGYKYAKFYVADLNVEKSDNMKSDVYSVEGNESNFSSESDIPLSRLANKLNVAASNWKKSDRSNQKIYKGSQLQCKLIPLAMETINEKILSQHNAMGKGNNKESLINNKLAENNLAGYFQKEKSFRNGTKQHTLTNNATLKKGNFKEHLVKPIKKIADIKKVAEIEEKHHKPSMNEIDTSNATTGDILPINVLTKVQETGDYQIVSEMETDIGQSLTEVCLSKTAENKDIICKKKKEPVNKNSKNSIKSLSAPRKLTEIDIFEDKHKNMLVKKINSKAETKDKLQQHYSSEDDLPLNELAKLHQTGSKSEKSKANKKNTTKVVDVTKKLHNQNSVDSFQIVSEMETDIGKSLTKVCLSKTAENKDIICEKKKEPVNKNSKISKISGLENAKIRDGNGDISKTSCDEINKNNIKRDLLKTHVNSIKNLTSPRKLTEIDIFEEKHKNVLVKKIDSNAETKDKLPQHYSSEDDLPLNELAQLHKTGSKYIKLEVEKQNTKEELNVPIVLKIEKCRYKNNKGSIKSLNKNSKLSKISGTENKISDENNDRSKSSCDKINKNNVTPKKDNFKAHVNSIKNLDIGKKVTEMDFEGKHKNGYMNKNDISYAENKDKPLKQFSSDDHLSRNALAKLQETGSKFIETDTNKQNTKEEINVPIAVENKKCRYKNKKGTAKCPNTSSMIVELSDIENQKLGDENSDRSKTYFDESIINNAILKRDLFEGHAESSIKNLANTKVPEKNLMKHKRKSDMSRTIIKNAATTDTLQIHIQTDDNLPLNVPAKLNKTGSKRRKSDLTEKKSKRIKNVAKKFPNNNSEIEPDVEQTVIDKATSSNDNSEYILKEKYSCQPRSQPFDCEKTVDVVSKNSVVEYIKDTEKEALVFDGIKNENKKVGKAGGSEDNNNSFVAQLGQAFDNVLKQDNFDQKKMCNKEQKNSKTINEITKLTKETVTEAKSSNDKENVLPDSVLQDSNENSPFINVDLQHPNIEDKLETDSTRKVRFSDENEKNESSKCEDQNTLHNVGHKNKPTMEIPVNDQNLLGQNKSVGGFSKLDKTLGDQTIKDQNQTSSTGASGRKTKRKLYDPSDISHLEMADKEFNIGERKGRSTGDKFNPDDNSILTNSSSKLVQSIQKNNSSKKRKCYGPLFENENYLTAEVERGQRLEQPIKGKLFDVKETIRHKHATHLRKAFSELLHSFGPKNKCNNLEIKTEKTTVRKIQNNNLMSKKEFLDAIKSAKNSSKSNVKERKSRKITSKNYNFVLNRHHSKVDPNKSFESSSTISLNLPNRGKKNKTISVHNINKGNKSCKKIRSISNVEVKPGIRYSKTKRVKTDFSGANIQTREEVIDLPESGGNVINNQYIASSNSIHNGEVNSTNTSYKAATIDGVSEQYFTISPHSQSRKVAEVGISRWSAEVSERAPIWTGNAVLNNKFVSIQSSDYMGKYLVMFFYPTDFGFLPYVQGPIEILQLNQRIDDFRKMNADVVACSVDSRFTHLAWISSMKEKGDLLQDVKFPIISDGNHKISRAYDIYVQNWGHTFRGLFVVNPEGMIIRKSIVDLPFKLNVDEVFDWVETIQTTDNNM